MSAFFDISRAMAEKTLDGDCHAVILAAGRSGRMGREKARLPWLDGKPLLLWMVDELSAAGWRPVVVLGPEYFDSWKARLPAGCAVLNPRPERGKTTSLAAGVHSLPASVKWILVTAVDQPRPGLLYRRLRLEAGTCAQKIIVPDRKGRRGHPVALSGSLRERLLALDEHSLGLRGLLDEHEDGILRLPGFDPDWLKWDLNTPAVYQEALGYFQGISNR